MYIIRSNIRLYLAVYLHSDALLGEKMDISVSNADT